MKDVEKLPRSRLEEPQRRWDDLDTALAEAVYIVATGLFCENFYFISRNDPNLAMHILAVPLFGMCMSASS